MVTLEYKSDRFALITSLPGSEFSEWKNLQNLIEAQLLHAVKFLILKMLIKQDAYSPTTLNNLIYS
jgi:hypothetical protein